MPKAYFIGDSITEGAKSSTPQKRWTSLLCLKKGWDEVNLGLSGEFMDPSGSPSIQARYESCVPVKGKNDKYLFFAYGTNDINYNDGVKTPKRFAQYYDQLLLDAERKGWSGSEIIIIAGYFYTNYRPFKIYQSSPKRQKAYLAAAKFVANKHHAQLFDLVDPMRLSGGERLLSDDFVHPNDDGYKFIANYLVNQIR